MVQKTVPAAKRLPNAHYRELRRARIFMRLREGRPYTEIAREEGLTDTRIRQIISETLKKRVVDPPTDDAMLQLMRLEPALRLAAEAVVSGDLKAVRYYLKLLDQLDRCEPAAARPSRRRRGAREALRQDGPDRRASTGENRQTRRWRNRPARAEAGDPMREGEAGVEIRALGGNRKNPRASAATP